MPGTNFHTLRLLHMHLETLSREVELIDLPSPPPPGGGGVPRGGSWFLHQGEILSRSPWPSPKTRSYLGRLGLYIRVRSYLGHPGLHPRRDLISIALVFSSGRDLISVTLAFIQDEILSRSPWSSHQGEILSRSPWPSSKTRSYLGRLGLVIGKSCGGSNTHQGFYSS